MADAMSIWSSVDGPDIIGPADYRQRRDSPTVIVDVATNTNTHQHIRLSLFSDNAQHDSRLGYAEVDLPVDQAQRLIERLTQAVSQSQP